jgi:hypothetical protein
VGERRERLLYWTLVRRRVEQTGYDASQDLVQELLRTALTLHDLFADLVETMPDGAYPGEDNAEVLLEMFAGSARRAVVAAGEAKGRAATALVEAVRESFIDDLKRALELSRQRGREGRIR